MKRIIINILSIMIIVLFCNFAISCNLKDTTGTDYIPLEQRTNSYSSGWAHMLSSSLMRIDAIDENNPYVISAINIFSIRADGLNDSEYTVSISSVNKKNDSRLELVASDFELASDKKSLRLIQSGLDKFKTYSSDFAFRTNYEYEIIFKFTTTSDKVQEKEVYLPIKINLNKLNYIKENQFEEVLLDINEQVNIGAGASVDFSDSSWLADYPNFYIDINFTIRDDLYANYKVSLSSDNAAENILSSIQNSSSFSKYFSKVEYLKNMTQKNGKDIVLYFNFIVKNSTYYIDKDIQNINKIVNNSRHAAISIQLYTPENLNW